MADSDTSAPTAVELLQRETCYQGFYRLERLTLRHQLFSGAMGRPISRELFVRHDAVCVLPYDAERDEVVLIEQFRVGAYGKSQRPWLLELVAGLIDKDEEPQQVALREAQEEAGLALQELHPVTAYFPSPGGSDERVHLFIGRCSSLGASGVHGLEEEGEDIRVQVLSLDQALEYIDSGLIDNAATLIALQWLALNRQRLRERWA